MAQYLLSVHSIEGESTSPMTEEDMGLFMKRIFALEEEMKAENALVYSARLTGPDAAKVVRAAEDQVLTTDGPFAESKEQIAGFYIIDTDDLDAALAWAAKVTECVGKPIEVRPFQSMHGA
ncbi:MAG: YciI family protein [Actinomycetota bacterium]